MAKLVIYRGETLDREVELGERNARIGRGDQNDIVLPDPAKSVSRFHAELRFEGGKYSVVDLNSQNGTWVAGRRVQQAVLEPGVPVVLGTYRLMLKGDQPMPVTDSDATIIRPGPRVTAPEALATPTVAGAAGQAPAAPAKPEAAPAQAAAAKPAAPVAKEPPKVEAPAAMKADAPAPKVEPVAPKPAEPAPKPAPKPEPPAVKAEAPPPKPAPPPPPPKPAAPPPAPAPAPAAKPAAKPAPAARPPKRGVAKGLVFGGLAVVLIFVVGAAGATYFFWPSLKHLVIPGHGTATATQTAAQGQPAPTPTENPPAVAATPAKEPPPPPAAPEPSVAAAPPEQPAEAAPTAGGRAGTAPRAAERRPATESTARPPRRGAAAPAGPAAPKRPGPTVESKVTAQDAQSAYAQAKSSMIKGEYLTAIAALNLVLKFDPRYLDAAQMLDTARAGARNQAQLAVELGNRTADTKDYLGAVKQYERALQLDASLASATEAMKRVRALMAVDGADAFKRAKQYDALGRAADAIPLYEKAVQYLPPDDPNSKIAKDRLAALKGGSGLH